MDTLRQIAGQAMALFVQHDEAVFGVCGILIVLLLFRMASGKKDDKTKRQAASGGVRKRVAPKSLDDKIVAALPLYRGVQKKLSTIGYGTGVWIFILASGAGGVALAQFITFGVFEKSVLLMVLEALLCIALFQIIIDRIILTPIAERRRNLILAQIPGAIDTLVRTLKIGRSFDSALQVTAQQTEAPISEELQVINQMIEIGAAPEQAMRTVAADLELPEFDFIVSAYSIHLETGGDLAKGLEALSRMTREKAALSMKVDALVAEGKASGWVISALPVLMFGYFWIFKREYIEPLLSTPSGQQFLSAAAVLVVSGILTMRRITRFKA